MLCTWFQQKLFYFIWMNFKSFIRFYYTIFLRICQQDRVLFFTGGSFFLLTSPQSCQVRDHRVKKASAPRMHRRKVQPRHAFGDLEPLAAQSAADVTGLAVSGAHKFVFRDRCFPFKHLHGCFVAQVGIFGERQPFCVLLGDFFQNTYFLLK